MMGVSRSQTKMQHIMEAFGVMVAGLPHLQEIQAMEHRRNLFIEFLIGFALRFHAVKAHPIGPNPVKMLKTLGALFYGHVQKSSWAKL
jgi:hypothetical protein